MPRTIGRVEHLKLATEYGIVRIRRETPTGLGVPPKPPGPPTEDFLIWAGPISEGPRGLFTTELSRALASGLRVRITHESQSAFIRELLVFAPLEGAVV